MEDETYMPSTTAISYDPVREAIWRRQASVAEARQFLETAGANNTPATDEDLLRVAKAIDAFVRGEA